MAKNKLTVGIILSKGFGPIVNDFWRCKDERGLERKIGGCSSSLCAGFSGGGALTETGGGFSST